MPYHARVGQGTNAVGRRNDLDWLRVLATLAVLFFHCGRFLDDEGWHVKNRETSVGISVLVQFIVIWLMPVFFVVSGQSVHYLLRGATNARFLVTRVTRLLVPFVFGVLVLIPPQVWAERASHGQWPGSFLAFLPRYFDGWYGFGGNFAWMGLHLWYLEALFLFSLLCLPLYVWFRNGPGGQRALHGLGDFLARPGAVYLLALPAYVLVNVLDPDSWGTSVLGGWSIFIYLCFFVSGFLIYSNGRLQASIKRWRWVSLAVGLLMQPSVDILWDALGDPPFATPGFAIATAPYCLGAWCMLLAILGFGMQHLTRSTPFLKYANEAVLPFYILHQTVILCLGYLAVQRAIPDLPRFLVILLGSLLIVMGLYEFLIRRNDLLRVLFGMKPSQRRSTEPRPVLAEQSA